MSKHISMTAFKREGTGKGTARALRRDNKVPAVIYGDNKEPVSITLLGNEITKEYHKGHLFTHLTDLNVDGEKQLVLARDVQLHPVKDTIEHVDYLRVTKKTRIPVDIPVHFINEDKCPGLRDGGILAVTRYQVEVYCSALDIPEGIEIDLSSFQKGDIIKSSAVKLPAGAEFTISDREFTIAAIETPRAAPVEDEEGGDVAADEVEASEQSGDDVPSEEKSDD